MEEERRHREQRMEEESRRMEEERRQRQEMMDMMLGAFGVFARNYQSGINNDSASLTSSGHSGSPVGVFFRCKIAKLPAQRFNRAVLVSVVIIVQIKPPFPISLGRGLDG
jgi:hypothetical protein